MTHITRNQTIALPVEVRLFDGLDALPGEAANLNCQVMCVDNGYQLDQDLTFKASPSNPDFSMATYTSAFTNLYRHVFQPGTWPRGQYRAIVNHTGGLAYEFDYSVGLFCNRRLEYGVVYDGSTLKLALWVCEDGEPQSDYSELSDITLADGAGNVVATPDAIDCGGDGIFRLTLPVTLAQRSIYTLTCTGHVDQPAGFPTLAFPLRLALVRP